VTEAYTLVSSLRNLGANVGSCYPQAISGAVSQSSSEIILNGQQCFSNVTEVIEKTIRNVYQLFPTIVG